MIVCAPICRPTSDPLCFVSQDLRRHVAYRRGEEPLRVRRVRQQRLHLPSQRLVVPAGRCHERGALVRRRDRAPRRRGPRYAAGIRDRSRGVSFELAQQPEFRQAPVALDRVGRHVEHLRRLLHAQATEESQLDDSGSFAASTFANASNARSSARTSNAGSGDGDEPFVQRHPLRAAAAFAIPARPRVIDEHAPHQASRDAEKVRAVLPADAAGRPSVAETPRSRPPWSARCGRAARGPCTREPAGAAPPPRAAAADRARPRRRRSTPEAAP